MEGEEFEIVEALGSHHSFLSLRSPGGAPPTPTALAVASSGPPRRGDHPPRPLPQGAMPQGRDRVPGSRLGQVVIADDFDEPLELEPLFHED